MAFSFLKFIWNQMSDYIRDNDSYVDGNGKGFFERYIEIFEEELDEQTKVFIQEFIPNLNPLTADPKFINALAYTLGNPPDIFDLSDINVVEDRYRHLLSYITNIYKIKGTKLSYEILFSFFNLGVIIIEYNTENLIWDGGFKWDDGQIWDDQCRSCSNYDLLFYSLDDVCSAAIFVDIPQQDIDKLDKVIEFLEPINSKLGVKTRTYPFCDTISISSYTEEVHIQHIVGYTFDSGDLWDDGLHFDSGTITQDITI